MLFLFETGLCETEREREALEEKQGYSENGCRVSDAVGG